ncbi:hypothetical protein [Algibacter pacificus]|uniref:hypothetical protein n=1 Tax=Algibacter pacificus TaxID=2599389 RepID=UPI0011C9D5B5|nr:hypothetical protein [Algibacter pacificus]
MRYPIIKIYNFFYSKNAFNQYKKTNKIIWFICNIGFRLCEIAFYYCIKLSYYLSKPFNFNDSNSEIIVSLTSFPERINDLWITVDSIMRQSYLPKRVILYLSIDQFPKGLNSLPKSLLRYREYGLDIEFKEDDLKPHKKYFYAMQDYPKDLLVTIDDDLYYQRNALSSLINIHKKYPEAVCANVVRVIDFNSEGEILPYSEWTSKFSLEDCPSHKILAVGGGGVLYPISLFKERSMFDVNLIKENALYTDDLWLKAYELLNDISVATAEYKHLYIEIFGSQTISLKSKNVNKKIGNNDKVWSRLNDLFEINNLLQK